MLLISISAFPVFVILLYLYFRDKYEKEPMSLLLRAFAGGVFSAIATLLVLAPYDVNFLPTNNLILNALFKSFFLAAIPEELLKFIFLYWIIWKNSNFNEYFDGIVYAVFVSLGFAFFENVLYVSQHGVEVGIMRALLAVPAHALFGVIMGYYFSLARFSNTNTFINLSKSILYAILAHGIYNFLIFWYADSVGKSPLLSLLLVVAFFAFVVFLWRTGLGKIKHHVELSVFKK